MRLTIAYSNIKKRNLVSINNDTHQRETLSERPIRPPLIMHPVQEQITHWGSILDKKAHSKVFVYWELKSKFPIP